MSSPPVAVTAEHLPSSSRYRHPGDVIRLIAAGILLACALAASAIASRYLLGPAASVPDDLGSAGRVTTGLVQVACLAAAAVMVAATLRGRRFRLLAGLAAGAAAAAVLAAAIFALFGRERPAALTTDLARGSWVAGAAFPAPALFASAAAVVVAAAPWLSRPWRRVAWLTLLLAAVLRILVGTMLPMELILALATGVTVGAGVLVAFGVPDRRIGSGEIAAALGRAGVPVESVRPAEVESKGSRPFAAVAADGRRLFVKALGSDQRDADLLYRAYRAVRLRNVGDTRPAASLFHAVEHQALVGVMAERAGVSAPCVDRVVRAGSTALLVMEWIDGSSLDRLPAGHVSDEMLVRLWAEVDKLHRARIAHRSLRPANVMVTQAGLPRIVDFSFSELDATQRQMDLDVAELLASLATLAGEDRATSAAAEVLGGQGLARSVSLLQPLALSTATRRAIARHDGLLARTRSAAAAASGQASQDLARVQRVRPTTLLAIAAAAGAFYYVLPKLAQVGSGGWQALQSAHWIWLPVVIACSALTYLASAIALLGSVSVRLPFRATTLAQGASSFVNRVSPSNVGGMALNVRFLQKAGVEPSAGVTAVGVNALAGLLVHVALLVIFFTWAGHTMAHVFKLPSSSKLLVILSVAAAVVGIAVATRQGRRFAARKLLPPVRSSLASLLQVARSPAKLALLFGGSALVTLAYVGGLVASVEAFGGGPGIAEVGAVYMAVSVIAATSPTPGGLGAFETAAIAGLGGIGLSSGAAVSAVLIFRLATYWLPVLPGWLSWRLLQRMNYV